MDGEAISFGKETAALLVKDAAELVIKQLIVDRKIRFDAAQMETLAKTIAPHIGMEIDYEAIAQRAFDKIAKLNDSTDYLLTEAIRTDFFERIKKIIPKPVHGKDGRNGLNGQDGRHGINGLHGRNGTDYKLTDQDKKKIAADDQIRSDVVESVMASQAIVSREHFNRKLKELKRLIDSVEKNGKRGMNAGISGQDMIDEITKTFGNEIWQGGGGATSPLLTEITASSSRDVLATDMQKIIRYNNGGSDLIYTIRTNAVVAIPIGSFVDIYRSGSGDIDIVRSGVTFEGELGTSPGNVDFKLAGGLGSLVRLRKRLIDTWVYSGPVSV